MREGMDKTIGSLYEKLLSFMPVLARCAGYWAIALSLLCAGHASARTLTVDTVWSGEVSMQEDILVPAGVVLTILPGTKIKVSRAESTKTDPEYISPLTELTVRGSLLVSGSEAAPVEFAGEPGAVAGSWGGVLVDGGDAVISHCIIQSAENAVQVFSGSVELTSSVLMNNRYALVAQGSGSRVISSGSSIRENDYGVSLFDGAIITEKDSQVTSNRKRDRNEWNGRLKVPAAAYPSPASRNVTREYRDEVLKGENVWSGRITVTGEIRIPEGSRLIIMPDTIVEFRRRDTNGDGIGESGLLVQGVIVAKGTRERPIFFRSAEKNPRTGDWDAINLMNSDGIRNLLEYCQFEDAYRGLHFHFANVAVTDSVFINSYRGIQFQESRVQISRNRFYANKSAVQGRNSEIVFDNNVVSANLRGVNIFRSTLSAAGNRFSANAIDGLRVRDAAALVEHNLFHANRFGLMAQDSQFGRYVANVVSGNAELGFSLKNLDNLEIADNYFAANGSNGISLQDVNALITGNSFLDNRERGIGIISFDGIIKGNNFASNGLYALELEGSGPVSAPDNWWGVETPGDVIYDGKDLTGRGVVDAALLAKAPLPYVWPLSDVPVDTLWRGELVAKETLTVPAGITLGIAPGTKVLMGAEVSLLINGKLSAKGESGRRIIFTALGTLNPGAWGEVLLERSTDSVVEFCDFTGATWGIHSHFTNLAISESRFENNYGGFRFRSGPVSISNSIFKGNEIGIRSFRGVATISGNEITGNGIGIFVREKGGGLDIRNNNLAGNTGYALRIGDFNDEDVMAPRNWWGGNPESFIFDARQEEGIGFVNFDPPLADKPLAGTKE